MNRLHQLCLILCLLWPATLPAQVNANLLMPPQVDMTRNGWDVTTQQGNLTYGWPFTPVPGEVPIPVSFALRAFSSSVWMGREYDPDFGHAVGVRNEINRPTVGAVHFGYISDPSDYSGTTIQGLTVLENGIQIPDNQWKAFSSNTTLGTALNLPQAYGFSAVSTSTAMVDPTATYLSYTTTAAGLGATYQAIVQGLPPSGFGSGSTNYKVVIDKNRARVFAYATTARAWVPVLWADRFNHYVTFQWTRSATGLPVGITAITKVVATNQRSKGVVLRWAEYASNQAVADILRVDYVGLHAPSILVKGYPGYTTSAPVGFTHSAFMDYRWTVTPSIVGSLCRPTSIQVGAFPSISQPTWSNSGSPAAAAPGAPPADGTSDSPTRTWSLSYDTNMAGLNTVTEPSGLTTTFLYTQYSALSTSTATINTFGVSEVRAVDTNNQKLYKRWTRTYPSGTAPMQIKVEGWWDPNLLANPNRYQLLTFYTDSLNFGNGVYQTDTLKDTAGITWSTATYTYSTVGAGVNASLSRVQSVTVQEADAPAVTTAFGYPNSTNLQVTQVNVSAKNGSGPTYLVSATTNTYATRWDMLDGRQLTQVSTIRYAANGTTALPAVVQKHEYNSQLLLQNSYLDGGTIGRHGEAYAYDTQGRPSTRSVYHLEGTQALTSPFLTSLSYDAASGMTSSQTWTDQSVVPNVSLTNSAGGFNSFGQPTTTTDTAGITTTSTYDDRGRVLSASRPGDATITYAYPNERTVKVTVNSLTTTTAYDGFGRVSSVTRPSGFTSTGTARYIAQTPIYDAYGRQISLRETNPAGTVRSQSQSYDVLDRVVSQTPMTGNAATLTYAASGINRKVTTTLSNQSSSATYLNPLGQVVRTDAPDGTVTTITYDQFGNQKTVSIQPSGGAAQNRSFTYDALNRLTSKTEPETNTQTFSQFNALNQPQTIVEAANTADARTRTLTYDGFGRMINMVNGPDSLSQTYSGPNLASATRTIGGTAVSQTFAYNGPGSRLSSETTSQPGLTSGIQYAYDAAKGTLSGITYPSGRQVAYSYDALGRATGITQNGATLVSTVAYDDWGNLSQIGFPSGSQDQWEADLTGTRLNKWSIGFSSGTPESRTYTYDDATNILKTAGEWTLTHDTSGRLTQADGFGIKTTHGHDGYGNNISHLATANPNPVPPTLNNFTFNPMANNQIPGLTSSGALTGWNTNLRGEATQVGTATASGQALGLGWDGLGLVKSVVWNAGNQSYLYAPSGLRVSVTDSTTSANSRKYAYTSTGTLLAEYTGATWKRDVIYLGGRAIAEIDAAGVHELHSDHLGSPRLITRGSGTWATNLNGTTEGTQAYGPYGERIQSTGYVPLTGYTGHLQTDASGLIYMRGRYYSPAWHAFVNSDHGLDPNQWNQRAYVGGSPFMATDPSGMRLVPRGTPGVKGDGSRVYCDKEGGCDTTSSEGWVAYDTGSATVEVSSGYSEPFRTLSTPAWPNYNTIPVGLFGGSTTSGSTTSSPQTTKPNDCNGPKSTVTTGDDKAWYGVKFRGNAGYERTTDWGTEPVLGGMLRAQVYTSAEQGTLQIGMVPGSVGFKAVAATRSVGFRVGIPVNGGNLMLGGYQIGTGIGVGLEVSPNKSGFSVTFPFIQFGVTLPQFVPDPCSK